MHSGTLQVRPPCCLQLPAAAVEQPLPTADGEPVRCTGRMAGVAIAGDAKTDVSCMYKCGYASLPTIEQFDAQVCKTLRAPSVHATNTDYPPI